MNDPIKILFFIDSFRIGGMHKQILYLIKYINKDIFEPLVCTSSTNGALRKEYELTGCKLYDLNWQWSLDIRLIFRLVKVLRIAQPDILFISEAQNLFYYQIARFFSVKKAIQIGSFRGPTFWRNHRNVLYQLIDHFFSKWLYVSSIRVTVNSKSMVEHYSKIIGAKSEKNLQVIYNGSDFNFPVNKNAETIKRELNLSKFDSMIIMLARLDPRKDFETFLTAAGLIVKTRPNSKFIILGDGELRNELEEKIIDMGLNGIVLILGEKTDVFDYINAADISVLSTYGEGFSNSILESLALGKPVIATDVGGNHEILKSIEDASILDGKVRLLVPPKSSILLASAILRLLDDELLQKKIGEIGKVTIRKLCNLKRYISSHEALFIEVLKK